MDVVAVLLGFAAVIFVVSMVVTRPTKEPPNPADHIHEMFDRLVARPLELRRDLTHGAESLRDYDVFVLRNNIVTVVYRIRHQPNYEEYVTWEDDLEDLTIETRTTGGYLTEVKILGGEHSSLLTPEQRGALLALRDRTNAEFYEQFERYTSDAPATKALAN